MKLIRCYIENFGKLQQFSYSFGESLNIIHEENGWGKTTFAAFLKAMFYGMEYKQGKIITDRKRYQPWNNGKFGGYLIFEVEGKEYKIQRFFGKKDKEDSCIVYDIATNQVTEDYNEHLGEELWKVDRESFEHTAFISLEESELLNDIIANKLGDINDAEADMDASGKAIETLDVEMTRIKSRRGKSGSYWEKQEEIHQLKQEIKDCKGNRANIEQLERTIKEEEARLIILDAEIASLDQEQEKFVLYEKKKQYLELLREVTQKQQEVDALASIFHGKVPDEEALELCNSQIVQLANLCTQKRAHEPSVKTQEEFHRLELKYGELIGEDSTCRKERGSKQIDQFLEAYSRVTQIQSEENILKAEYNELELQLIRHKEEIEKTKSKTRFVAGMGISIIGIILGIKLLIPGIILVVIGQLLNLFIYFSNKKPKLQEEIGFTEEKIKEITLKLKQREENKSKLEQSYLQFLQKMGEDTQQVVTSLSNIKVEIENYLRQAKEREEIQLKLQSIELNIREKTTKIEAFLGQYFTLPLGKDNEIFDYKHELGGENFLAAAKARVDELRKHKIQLESKQNETAMLKQKIENFKQENPMDILEHLIILNEDEKEVKANILNRKIQLAKDKELAQKRKNNNEKDINDLSISADKVEDIESQMLKLEEESEILLSQYTRLEIAKECMEQAKNGLATKYMSEMTRAFNFYLGEMNAEKFEPYQLDIKLKVQVEQDGEMHDSSELSKGLKDLVQICMRMALVEAVYKGVEKPILILDDPFVNLDNERLEKAKRMLTRIGKEYQMVYFICHESRCNTY